MVDEWHLPFLAVGGPAGLPMLERTSSIHFLALAVVVVVVVVIPWPSCPPSNVQGHWIPLCMYLSPLPKKAPPPPTQTWMGPCLPTTWAERSTIEVGDGMGLIGPIYVSHFSLRRVAACSLQRAEPIRVVGWTPATKATASAAAHRQWIGHEAYLSIESIDRCRSGLVEAGGMQETGRASRGGHTRHAWDGERDTT